MVEVYDMRKKIIYGIVIGCMIAFTVFGMVEFLTLMPAVKNDPVYLLQISSGTVQLFENGTPVKKYPEIVVDNLPYEDRQKLSKGIKFSSRYEAELAVEDYDG